MGHGDVTVWTNWVHEETEVVMNQLEEELVARGDPDEPFNGSANGVFQPLQENFSLPPSIQTPRRQENTSKHSKSSWKLLRNSQEMNTTGMNMKKNEAEVQSQAVPCKFSKHSLELLDPMRSIRNLHIQQRQNCLQAEVLSQNGAKSGPRYSPNVSPQEPNLIMFNPPLDSMKQDKMPQEGRVNQRDREVLEGGMAIKSKTVLAEQITGNFTHFTKGTS